MFINSFVLLSLICIKVLLANDRLSVRVVHHSPCIRKGTKTPWPLVLPSIKEAPVLRDADDPNCYRITGDVKVNRPVRGKLYAYVELKNEVNGEPRPCYNAKANGCGGIGS
uniref:Uncharacterized protein n=1 Tax=Romanomermis culicivorax TaxID=13658 RepID=A0A915JXD5_ROMCU